MASKRAMRRKACDGKIRHADQQAARNTAHKLFRMKGDRVHAYKCAFCNGWHVGHYGKRWDHNRMAS